MEIERLIIAAILKIVLLGFWAFVLLKLNGDPAADEAAKLIKLAVNRIQNMWRRKP